MIGCGGERKSWARTTGRQGEVNGFQRRGNKTKVFLRVQGECHASDEIGGTGGGKPTRRTRQRNDLVRVITTNSSRFDGGGEDLVHETLNPFVGKKYSWATTQSRNVRFRLWGEKRSQSRERGEEYLGASVPHP